VAQGGKAGHTKPGYAGFFPPAGVDGKGQGGGIYISLGASAGLDAFTQANTRTNTASTSDNDIFGSFTILA
jgi:hypothetical protein